MEAMTKHRSHSAAFKRQVAQEFIAGETLHGLSQRHDISRQLIRIWVGKFEAGALDEDVQATDLIQEYEAKIAALERLVGRPPAYSSSRHRFAGRGLQGGGGWTRTLKRVWARRGAPTTLAEAGPRPSAEGGCRRAASRRPC